MNKIDRALNLIFVSELLCMACVVLLFEVIRPEWMGVCFNPDDRTVCTVMETVSVLGSLAGVYGALKLFSIPSVAMKLSKDGDSYMIWALYRALMLFAPMYLCLFTYYLFISTNVVAFLGIGAICLLFIWPTRSRREREMNRFTEQN